MRTFILLVFFIICMFCLSVEKKIEAGVCLYVRWSCKSKIYSLYLEHSRTFGYTQLRRIRRMMTELSLSMINKNVFDMLAGGAGYIMAIHSITPDWIPFKWAIYYEEHQDPSETDKNRRRAVYVNESMKKIYTKWALNEFIVLILTLLIISLFRPTLSGLSRTQQAFLTVCIYLVSSAADGLVYMRSVEEVVMPDAQTQAHAVMLLICTVMYGFLVGSNNERAITALDRKTTTNIKEMNYLKSQIAEEREKVDVLETAQAESTKRIENLSNLVSTLHSPLRGQRATRGGGETEREQQVLTLPSTAASPAYASRRRQGR